MKAEYDFSNAVRGKHAARFAQGSNIVVIDPDVTEIFPDAKSVNDALRSIAGIIRSRSQGRARKTLRRPTAARRR
jgi:hypothetical protein